MLAPARKTILGLILAGSLLFAVGPAHAASCVTGATTTTCLFLYTGAAEDWIVPAGVTSAVFDVHGAQGGDFAPVSVLPGGFGGKGGRVQATLALTPGETLHLRVGGRGGDGFIEIDTGSGTRTVAGGFNGGGTNTFTCDACEINLGGSGGGSSDVRTSGDGLADRLLVAGGGGGAGFGSVTSDPGNGGNSANAAKSVTNGASTCSGGGPGTLVGPGAAGSGPGCSSGSPGAAGGLTGGGTSSMAAGGSGAGGGGYFGGGAGAAGPFGVSGGGGGSDYVDPSATNVTITDGFQSGTGAIIVTYANQPTAVTFASASATRTAKGILLRWRTGTEADLLGFHVYRSRGDTWQRITHSLLAAKRTVSGASYRFLDRTARRGVAYRYRIKAVHSDGTAAWLGPMRVA